MGVDVNSNGQLYYQYKKPNQQGVVETQSAAEDYDVREVPQEEQYKVNGAGRYVSTDPVITPNVGAYIGTDTDSYARDLVGLSEMAKRNDFSVEDQYAAIQTNLNRFGRAAINNVTIAGTTAFGNIVGLVDGVTRAIIEGRGSAIWDNPVNRTVADIINKTNAKYGIHRSQDYENKSIGQQLLSGVFWADFLQNLGYTEGALLSGAATGGILGAGMASAVVGSVIGAFGEASIEAINKKNEREKEQISTLLENYNKQYAALDPDDFVGKQRLESSLETTKAQIREDNLKAGNVQFALNLGLLSIGNLALYGEFLARGPLAKTTFNKMLTRNKVKARSQGIREVMESSEEAAIRGLEGKARRDAIKNLKETNKKALKDAKDALKVAKASKNTSEIAKAEKVLADLKKGNKNILQLSGDSEAWAITKMVGKRLGKGYLEGQEELLQGVFGRYVDNRSKFNSFSTSQFNPEAKQTIDGWLNAWGASFSEAFHDKQTATEFLSGVFTGILGAPAGQSRTVIETDADGKRVEKKRLPITMAGGFWDISTDIRRYRERKANIEEANAILRDPTIAEQYKNIITQRVLHDQDQEAINANDIFSSKTLRLERLLSHIKTFDRIGRLDMVNDMIKKVSNLTDEEIQSLIKDTSIDGNGPYMTNNNPMSTEFVRQKIAENVKEIEDVIEKYTTFRDELESAKGLEITDIYAEKYLEFRMKAWNFEERMKSIIDEIKIEPEIFPIYYGAVWQEYLKENGITQEEALADPEYRSVLAGIIYKDATISPAKKDSLLQKLSDLNDLESNYRGASLILNAMWENPKLYNEIFTEEVKRAAEEGQQLIYEKEVEKYEAEFTSYLEARAKHALDSKYKLPKFSPLVRFDEIVKADPLAAELLLRKLRRSEDKSTRELANLIDDFYDTRNDYISVIEKINATRKQPLNPLSRLNVKNVKNSEELAAAFNKTLERFSEKNRNLIKEELKKLQDAREALKSTEDEIEDEEMDDEEGFHLEDDEHDEEGSTESTPTSIPKGLVVTPEGYVDFDKSTLDGIKKWIETDKDAVNSEGVPIKDIILNYKSFSNKNNLIRALNWIDDPEADGFDDVKAFIHVPEEYKKYLKSEESEGSSTTSTTETPSSPTSPTATPTSPTSPTATPTSPSAVTEEAADGESKIIEGSSDPEMVTAGPEVFSGGYYHTDEEVEIKGNTSSAGNTVEDEADVDQENFGTEDAFAVGRKRAAYIIGYRRRVNKGKVIGEASGLYAHIKARHTKDSKNKAGFDAEVSRFLASSTLGTEEWINKGGLLKLIEQHKIAVKDQNAKLPVYFMAHKGHYVSGKGSSYVIYAVVKDDTSAFKAILGGVSQTPVGVRVLGAISGTSDTASSKLWSDVEKDLSATIAPTVENDKNSAHQGFIVPGVNTTLAHIFSGRFVKAIRTEGKNSEYGVNETDPDNPITDPTNHNKSLKVIFPKDSKGNLDTTNIGLSIFFNDGHFTVGNLGDGRVIGLNDFNPKQRGGTVWLAVKEGNGHVHHKAIRVRNFSKNYDIEENKDSYVVKNILAAIKEIVAGKNSVEDAKKALSHLNKFVQLRGNVFVNTKLGTVTIKNPRGDTTINLSDINAEKQILEALQKRSFQFNLSIVDIKQRLDKYKISPDKIIADLVNSDIFTTDLAQVFNAGHSFLLDKIVKDAAGKWQIVESEDAKLAAQKTHTGRSELMDINNIEFVVAGERIVRASDGTITREVDGKVEIITSPQAENLLLQLYKIRKGELIDKVEVKRSRFGTIYKVDDGTQTYFVAYKDKEFRFISKQERDAIRSANTRSNDPRNLKKYSKDGKTYTLKPFNTPNDITSVIEQIKFTYQGLIKKLKDPTMPEADRDKLLESVKRINKELSKISPKHFSATISTKGQIFVVTTLEYFGALETTFYAHGSKIKNDEAVILIATADWKSTTGRITKLSTFSNGHIKEAVLTTEDGKVHTLYSTEEIGEGENKIVVAKPNKHFSELKNEYRSTDSTEITQIKQDEKLAEKERNTVTLAAPTFPSSTTTESPTVKTRNRKASVGNNTTAERSSNNEEKTPSTPENTTERTPEVKPQESDRVNPTSRERNSNRRILDEEETSNSSRSESDTVVINEEISKFFASKVFARNLRKLGTIAGYVTDVAVLDKISSELGLDKVGITLEQYLSTNPERFSKFKEIIENCKNHTLNELITALKC